MKRAWIIPLLSFAIGCAITALVFNLVISHREQLNEIKTIDANVSQRLYLLSKLQQQDYVRAQRGVESLLATDVMRLSKATRGNKEVSDLAVTTLSRIIALTKDSNNLSSELRVEIDQAAVLVGKGSIQR